MKICCVSDLHGQLSLQTPECDLLLIAGDVCPTSCHASVFQADWINFNFCDWLKKQPAKKIVFIAGNHDYVFETRPWWHERFPADYLQDRGLIWVDGGLPDVSIWGTPWSPQFGRWAFMKSDADLAKRWALIPEGIDILVVHGPPKGYGDRAPRLLDDENECEWPGYANVGSATLTERIKEVKPRLVVCGHIHCDPGIHWLGDTPIVNAAVLDNQYHMVRSPIMFDLPLPAERRSA